MHFEARERRPSSMSSASCSARGRSTHRLVRGSSATTVLSSSRGVQELIRLCGMTHVRTSPLLSAVQRKAGALAQKRQVRGDSTCQSDHHRGGRPDSRYLRPALQFRASAQLLGLHCALDFMNGLSANLGRARSSPARRTPHSCPAPHPAAQRPAAPCHPPWR